MGEVKQVHMSTSLTNRLSLKKKIFELKMDEGMDVWDRMNKFNFCHLIVKCRG